MEKLHKKMEGAMIKQRAYSYITSEDPTCSVHCYCGKEVWTSDYEIVVCECGRGFKTEFFVHSYSLGYLKFLTIYSALTAKMVVFFRRFMKCFRVNWR